MSPSENYKIIDTDFHYYEGVDNLSEYLPEPWRTRVRDGGSPSALAMYPNFTGDNTVGGRVQREDYPGPMDIEDIRDGLDYLDIDKALLLSDITLVMQGMNSLDDRSVAIANASTDYMLENVIDPSAGLYSAIPVPYQHPESAVELIDRVGDEEGFVGIYIVTAGAEPPLGNKKYEIIYEKAEKKDLPVIFHSASSGLDEYHVDGFETVLSTHSLGFVEANMEQAASLLVQGIPEKFPNLDFLFLESGLFWVPLIMHRLDTEYMSRQSEAPILKKRPSEYLKENFYYGTQPLERPKDLNHLKYIIEIIGGAERIMYTSDYPHWDYDDPKVIAQLPFLSEDEKNMIFSENAEEVFGI